MSQFQHLLARLAVAAVAAAAVLAGLATWAAQDGLAGAANGPGPAPRSFIHEREFAERPELAALSHQVVILDLEPAAATQSLQENVARYRFHDGTYNFCLDKDDPHLTHLTLEDESGTPLAKVERGDGCRQVTLTAGVHTMRVWHDGGAISGAGRVAFVQAPSPTVPLNETDGHPVGGYWALQPDPTLDSQKRLGRLTLLPPGQHYPNPDSDLVEPMIVDFSSQAFDDSSLFLFRRYIGPPFNLWAQPRALDDTSLDMTDFLSPPYYLVGNLTATCDGDCSQLAGNLSPLEFDDLGNAKVSPKINFSKAGGSVLPYLYFYLASENWIRLFPPGFDQVTAQVLFRFFPDGMALDPPLREGEVALYQQCNYGGKATVFSLNTPDFSALTSPAITLDKSTASIRLGNNTAVNLYPEANFQGATQLIKADVPCLDDTPIGRETRSIQVQPLIPLVVASSDCAGCKLEGVDLSGKDLSGINLQGADLSGSTLTRTIFHNATSLTGTNFTGATLFCTDFSGAGTSPVDLTQTVFINAKFTEDFSCRADFAYTKLTPQSLPPSLWRYMNLSYAAIEGATNSPLSTPGQPLDLSQAILTGVSLPGVDLSAALLNNATLGSVNLSTAKLYGAKLDGANLEGANLSGAFLINNPPAGITAAASLVGARLKNVNLSDAQLSGANFTDANFYGSAALGEKTCDINAQGFTVGCATASGATMNNTQFGSAYLYGVDFTNTTIQGVQFGNAVLIGANFTGAKLSTDPTIGTESGFTGAFLQGANLASATLTGTSLDSAFVDFRQTGNDMYLRLDGNHTTFAGWPTPGQQVCIFVFYTGPTTVPTTNTTITCPDGSAAGSQGCGPVPITNTTLTCPDGSAAGSQGGGQTEAENCRWKSPVEIDQTNPPGSYLEDATYTKAATTPICSPLSGAW